MEINDNDLEKLIKIAESSGQHRIIDCSQPCGTPIEWHDVKNCDLCKLIDKIKKQYNGNKTI